MKNIFTITLTFFVAAFVIIGCFGHPKSEWRQTFDGIISGHKTTEWKKEIGDTTFTKTEVHGDCLSNWTLVSIVKETSSVRITECHFTFNGETTVDRDTVYFTAKKMSQAICLRPLS